MVLLSILLHGAVVGLTPRQEQAPRQYRKEERKPVPLNVRKEQVRLIEQDLKPAEEPVAAPPEPKPEPRPEPKPAPVRKPPKPKTEQPPPEPPRPEPAPKPKPAEEAPAKKPAPFVLSNVALGGGVAVQTGGDSNLFGDPSVDARGWKREGPDAPGRKGSGGDGSGSGSGNGTPEKVVIRPPVPLNQVKGEYPREFRDLNRVVRVQVELMVNDKGEVGDVTIRKGDLPAFDDEAKRTVQRLRFKPATRNGMPIPYKVKWTVVFLPEGN
jgi:TonB family protein